MCLAVPTRVLEKNENNMALVEVEGVKVEVSANLISDLNIGDYVLVHAGFIIEKISEEEAEDKLNTFDEVYKLMDEQETQGENNG